MATRFHFHASGSIACPNNPAFAAGWEQTAQATRLPMAVKEKKPITTALANSGNITIPITTSQQILCHQFTSNEIFKPVRLVAADNFSLVIRCAESATTANAKLAYSLRAFSADGARALGTLAESLANVGTEYAVTASAATRIFSAVALTATTLSEPWRLVLEIGAHAQAPTAAGTYLHRVGCSATTDFALTTALTTDLNPWMELSLSFGALVFANYQQPSPTLGLWSSDRMR